MLGDFLDAVGRVVGDDDAGLRSRLEIDRVHADAVAGDDPALRHSRHHLRGDRPGIRIEERVAVLRLRQKLLGFFRFEGHQIREPAQRILLDVQGFPDVVRQDHFRFSGHASSSSGLKRP